MRDFNFKINYSNNLFVCIPEKAVNYKIFIGRGNNSNLIQRFFRQRWYWTILETCQLDEANFVWSQLKNNDFLKTLKSSSKISDIYDD